MDIYKQMKFNIFRQYGALNSGPIFDAFSQGLRAADQEEGNDINSIPVIWSVLWAGRMLGNKIIYENAVKNNIPVVIIEVGNLQRNQTWRISVDHVNANGYFANELQLDDNRLKLFPKLKEQLSNRKSEILITTQRHESLQWSNQPSTEVWLTNIIKLVKSYTDRPIVVRYHPRSLKRPVIAGVKTEIPKKISSTYDEFDMSYNYHCVINHCSGTTIQSAVNGCPIICDPSGLAYPVSEKWTNLDNATLPNRHDWYVKLCHTEWTVDEIAKGIPLMRLLPYLQNRMKNIS